MISLPLHSTFKTKFLCIVILLKYQNYKPKIIKPLDYTHSLYTCLVAILKHSSSYHSINNFNTTANKNKRPKEAAQFKIHLLHPHSLRTHAFKETINLLFTPFHASNLKFDVLNSLKLHVKLFH